MNNPNKNKNIYKLKINSIMKYIQSINEFENNSQKNNIKIHRIAFYDFDGTIIDSPTPEMGKLIWEKKKKRLYPHKGWWSKKESLDFDVFELKPISEIIERLNKDIKDEHCWVVLLTNRMVKLEDEVSDVLDTLNIRFDEFQMYTDRNEPKSIRIKNVLQNYPQAHFIDIYDDDLDNLTAFVELRDELQQDGYAVQVFQVLPENYKPSRINAIKQN
jgi:FMN phosphatase YigB (HAD superfamily)